MSLKETSWIFYCNSGPEGCMERNEAEQSSVLHVAVGKRQPGFGPDAPAGPAGAQNDCKAQHEPLQQSYSYSNTGCAAKFGSIFVLCLSLRLQLVSVVEIKA